MRGSKREREREGDSKVTGACMELIEKSEEVSWGSDLLHDALFIMRTD